LISRLVIKPGRRWSSDAPLLIVFIAFWVLSLTLRRGAGIYNLLFEPALLAAAPIAFWLLLNLRFVTRLKLGNQPIGSQLLLMFAGVCVLLLFPLIPPRGGFG